MKPTTLIARGRIARALMASAIVLAAVGLSVPAPSAAELDGVQRTSWGLATFGESRAVANFSSLGWALEEMNGVVYVGGNFLETTNGDRTESQPYLAAFATSTGAFRDGFRPAVGGPVLSLEAAPDGGLFVGGEMDTWGGAQRGALMKIDPATGEPWPGWNTRVYGGTSVVRDVSLEPDGWLYVVGTFTTASDAGAPRTVNNVVRMDPVTGAIDWTWLPQPGGAVWGVSASRTLPTVYLAGWFSMAGKPAVGISTTDATRVTWSGFTMNFSCCDLMYDVQATEFGTVMFVGEQHGAYLYDEARGMAIIRTHATAYDSRHQASWSRRGGDYQAVVQVGDRLYATCHCWGSHSTTVGGIQAYNSDLARAGGVHTGLVSAVIAYDARTGERIRSFDPYMSGDLGGFDVLPASDGCLWVTGGINAVGEIGAQRPARDLVRLCEDGGPAPPPVPAPVSCLAVFDGSTVTVSWVAGDGGLGAPSDHVIHRSVDGGAPSWRGRTSGASFTDTTRSGSLVYLVSARDASGTRSEMTTCGNEFADPEVPLSPPVSCTATVAGASIEVVWPAAPGASEYVVHRSVDGGNQFWRGRTATLSFTDTSRAGTLAYFVSARNAAGEVTGRTPCQTVIGDAPEPDVVEPVASCTVAAGVDGVANSVVVTWPAADPAAEYIIARSVDGGSYFWRGRVSTLSFGDTLRRGTIQYSVEARVGGGRSTPTVCTPTVEGV